MKLISALNKEFLLLIRDKSGLGMLFIMPVLLVIIMALLQDGPYKSFQNSQFSVVISDYHKDTVTAIIEKALNESKIFTITKEINGKSLNEDEIRKLVADGKYKIGIVIPENLSTKVKIHTNKTINSSLSGQTVLKKETNNLNQIKIYLDPLTTFTLKNAVSSVLKKSVMEFESELMINAFYNKVSLYFPLKTKPTYDNINIIEFKEIYPLKNNKVQNIFNSVQHNVPAWTMFAIFFIFLPLAGGMIREREDGIINRLSVLPGSFFNIILGKIILYTIVGCIQFICMMIIGIYFFPFIGLNSLIIGNNPLAIIIVVLSLSICASSYGVLIGSVLSTQQQVVTFGSISVIIFAALGGIWVPAFLMSKAMLAVSKFSPLEWGLNSFNNIFIHYGNIATVMPDTMKLLLFSFISIIVSITAFYLKKLNNL